MLKRLLIALLPVVLALPPVQAQDAPRPGTLVRAWAASQAALGTDLERVELRERSEWTLDGPFGVRRTRMVARVAGGPDTDGWQRDPVAVEVDGRRVSPARWRELEERRLALIGPQTEQAARRVIQLHEMLGRMEPAGDTGREALDGVPCWRIDLVPRDRDAALERYTLWFDQAQGHLVRSRAVVRARRSETPLLITTDYVRVEGFDVPRRRRMEGTAQTRRRLRTYTLLFKYEAAYSDFRFFRKP